MAGKHTHRLIILIPVRLRLNAFGDVGLPGGTQQDEGVADYQYDHENEEYPEQGQGGKCPAVLKSA